MAAVPVLRGGDVILTGHDSREAAAHAAGEDEETARRFGWWPQVSTEQTVLAAYEMWAAQWRDDGPRRTFATRDATTGDLVGGCELRIGREAAGEVSYWTHADKRGRGYAKQSLALLCDYAASIGVTWLEAHVAVDNHASRHVAESAGFIESGTFTEEAEQRIRYARHAGGGTSLGPQMHKFRDDMSEFVNARKALRSPRSARSAFERRITARNAQRVIRGRAVGACGRNTT